jgi:hypothetical protein
MQPRYTARWLAGAALALVWLTPASAQQNAFNIPQNGFNNYHSQIVLSGVAAYEPVYGNDAQLVGENLRVTTDTQSSTRFFGSAYWNTPIDISQGFDTTFVMQGTSQNGFAFVLRSLSEGRTITTNLGDLGYNDFKNSVAVVFDGPNNLLYVDQPYTSGPFAGKVYQAGNRIGQTAFTLGNFNGSIRIRYQPLSQRLDVFINGAISPLLTTTIDLGSIVGNSAYMGFHSATFDPPNPEQGNQISNPTQVTAWLLNYQISPPVPSGPNYYQEPMTFLTQKQNVWNTTYPSWTYPLIATLDPKIYDSGDSGYDSTGGFGGRLYGSITGHNGSGPSRFGIRLDAYASGGTADITYPTLFQMTLPQHYTVDSGATLPAIPVTLSPTGAGGITTTSPTADFTATLILDFQVKAGLNVRLFGDDIIGGYGSSFSQTNVSTNNFKANVDTEFFSLKAILESGFFPFISGGQSTYGNAQAVYEGGKLTYQKATGASKGSTSGAGKGVNPLDFLSFNVTIPDLSTNGGVGGDYQHPFRIKSAASSPLFTITADFTSALLSLAGMGAFAGLLNNDLSFNLGAGGKYSVGWHFADLYGQVGLGSQVSFQFDPTFQLTLHLKDTNGNSYADKGPYTLTPSGYNAQTSITGITMPANGLPLVLTPEVHIFNTFQPTATLTVPAGLYFNPFQIYFNADWGTDSISLDTGPVLTDPPFPLTIAAGNIYSKDFPISPFQIGTQSGNGAVPFNVVTGRPFILMPAASTNPLIVSSSLTDVLMGTGSTSLSLSTYKASLGCVVVWDYGLPTATNLDTRFIDASHVNATIPASLLSQQGQHTLTLVNIGQSSQQFPSNAVAFNVSAPVPDISAVSPNLVTTGAAPTDGSGNPILLPNPNDPNNPQPQYFLLTVNGNGFVPAVQDANGTLKYAGSVVQWQPANGTKMPLPTQYVSANQLVAKVPAGYIANAGYASVSVDTGGPGGGSSPLKPITIANPHPVLTGLNQNTASPNTPGFALQVYGSGFVPGSVALWNGSPRETRFISDTTIEMLLTSNDLKVTGTTATVNNSIQVSNPEPGGGLSNSLTFTIGVKSSRPFLSIVPTLRRDPQTNEIIVSLRISNLGSVEAPQVAFGRASLGVTTTSAQTQTTTPLPVLVGTIPGGSSLSGTVEFRFPAPVGAAGLLPPRLPTPRLGRSSVAGSTAGEYRVLSLSGSMGSVPFNTNLRVRLP